VFEKLIAINQNNPQYRSSLAYFYRQTGQYEKARIQALKVLELSPESKPNVDAFLKTLP
jgi:Flp pilus assembly protein TadD